MLKLYLVEGVMLHTECTAKKVNLSVELCFWMIKWMICQEAGCMGCMSIQVCSEVDLLLRRIMQKAVWGSAFPLLKQLLSLQDTSWNGVLSCH